MRVLTSLPSLCQKMTNPVLKRTLYSSGKQSHDRIKKELTNILDTLKPNNSASTTLIDAQQPVIQSFIANSRAAAAVLEDYDGSGIPRKNQRNCFTEHAATRCANLDTLIETTKIYLDNGYQWLGRTPHKDGSIETHVYDLDMGTLKGIAIPLCFNPDLLSDKARQRLHKVALPVIENVFLSCPINLSEDIRHAVLDLPVPETVSDLYQKQTIKPELKSRLSTEHYLRSIVDITERHGIGGYNHLAERYPDVGGVFETLSIEDHFDRLTQQNPSLTPNARPSIHWRLSQWSFKQEENNPQFLEFVRRPKQGEYANLCINEGDREIDVPGFNFSGASSIVRSTEK